MARRIKVSAGILNIRLHPHSPDLYSQFIWDLYQLRTPVKVHGDRYAMISLINRSEVANGFVTGLITAFTHIDTDGTWFDASNLKAATEKQISEVQIPENLFPNAATFYFHFNLSTHKIYVQLYSKGKTFTINSALRFFNSLSENLKILEKYGSAKITVVQSKEGLNALFRMKTIKEIKITILKPNADIFSDDFEEKIEEHLSETRSKKFTLSYEADAGSSVRPTRQMRAVSEAALENGSVEVRGRDETGAVRRSTNEFPRIIQTTYDPDEIGESEAFRRLIPER